MNTEDRKRKPKATENRKTGKPTSGRTSKNDNQKQTALYLIVVIARVVYRGGNVNNGANCGLAYVNVNNGLGNANANIGCRVAD